MTILFAYDGSESADAAITTAAKLFEHNRVDAVVLSVWEPVMVEALRAARIRRLGSNPIRHQRG